jgi:hypothetical protein
VSETGPQISVAGFPIILANAHQAFGGNCTQAITGPGASFCAVLQGIDVWSSDIVGEVHGYYELSGGGKCLFYSRFNDDPLNIQACFGSWRGAIPILTGETVTVGIEMMLPASAHVAAWGVLLPYPGGSTL